MKDKDTLRMETDIIWKKTNVAEGLEMYKVYHGIKHLEKGPQG